MSIIKLLATIWRAIVYLKARAIFKDFPGRRMLLCIDAEEVKSASG